MAAGCRDLPSSSLLERFIYLLWFSNLLQKTRKGGIPFLSLKNGFSCILLKKKKKRSRERRIMNTCEKQLVNIKYFTDNF